jgi:hypothetical protein
MQSNRKDDDDGDDDDDDEEFMRSLIRPEEDRRRLYPDVAWQGGYRWFRSENVVPIEQWRERNEIRRPRR